MLHKRQHKKKRNHLNKHRQRFLLVDSARSFAKRRKKNIRKWHFLHQPEFHNETALWSVRCRWRKFIHADKVITKPDLLQIALLLSRNSLSPLLFLQKCHPVSQTVIKVSQLSSDHTSRSINSSRTQRESKVALRSTTPKESADKVAKQEHSLVLIDPKPIFVSVRNQSRLSEAKPAPENYKPKIKGTDSSKPPSNQKAIEMGQDVGSCCAKYILCLFNFIFFVSFTDLIRFCFLQRPIIVSLVWN